MAGSQYSAPNACSLITNLWGAVLRDRDSATAL